MLENHQLDNGMALLPFLSAFPTKGCKEVRTVSFIFKRLTSRFGHEIQDTKDNTFDLFGPYEFRACSIAE